MDCCDTDVEVILSWLMIVIPQILTPMKMLQDSIGGSLNICLYQSVGSWMVCCDSAMLDGNCGGKLFDDGIDEFSAII
jgi:hypothetical protein